MSLSISIAIPSSSLINERDEKIKTYKVGLIARAAAVFRVNEILIYHDPKLDESGFISQILEYLNTPQYLRKSIFPLRRELKYAGVLQPLCIPSHRAKHLKIGEIRDGVVRKVADGKCWVDIGVDALALMNSDSEMGARLTVRVCSKKPLVVEEAEPEDYWGYGVKIKSLEKVLGRKNPVITSRRCETPSPEIIIEKMPELTLIFGNPEEGVHEIMKRLKIETEAECWNMVPEQGTETVRLEEAIFASLAVINFVGKDRKVV
ncbi:MAG TPA: hypothetical protein EYP30_09840 [Archaeoglobaceae archaeon]|nr:hypothetical protein [Archaeoglobaceae archaeon]